MLIDNIDKILCLHCDKRKNDIEPLIESAEYNDFEIDWYITGDGTIYSHYDGIDQNFDGMVTMRNGEFVKAGTYPQQREWILPPDRQRVKNVSVHHQNILRDFLDSDNETILLLEDDVVFTNDARQILSNIEPPKDWNALLLGGFIKMPIEIFHEYPTLYNNNPKFLRIKKASGFYGVLLNKQGVREIFEFLSHPTPLTSNKENIQRFQPKDGPVDWSLTWIKKIYALMPPVIIERPNLSNITGWYKKRNMYEQAVLEGRIVDKEKNVLVASPLLHVTTTKKINKWAIGVTTAPRKKDYTLSRCVDSLHENGWNVNIFAEPNSKLCDIGDAKVIQQDKLLGLWRNWQKMVLELLIMYPDADAYLTVQDDTVIHPQAKWFAEKNFDLENKVWSFYTPTYYGHYANVYRDDKIIHEFIEGDYAQHYLTKDKTLRVEMLPKSIGLHQFKIRSLWGACAIIFPREILQRFVKSKIFHNWFGVIPNRLKPSEWKLITQHAPHLIKHSDTVIGNFINEEGIEYWFPVPSLAEHIARHSSNSIQHGGRDRNRHAHNFSYKDLREVFHEVS